MHRPDQTLLLYLYPESAVLESSNGLDLTLTTTSLLQCVHSKAWVTTRLMGEPKIVAPVARRLCRIFGTWSNIQDITVTNITFSSEISGVDDSVTPLLPEIPGLRSLYVGQATFLSAGSVAALFCVNRMASLEKVRLVDAYCESIWGSRIRRTDIEKAAQTIMFPQGVALYED